MTTRAGAKTSARNSACILGADFSPLQRDTREYGKTNETIMTSTQKIKALRFQELHRAPGTFLIPNPWDAGSARILAGLGFQALTTSSAAAAGVLGRRDGRMTREESLANARAIVEATDLPVAADLEYGFGDSPANAARIIW